MRPIAAFVGLAGSLLTSAAMAAGDPPKGMPQLDFANQLTISQVVWLVIIFTVLYLLLSRWALPQVGAVLEMRAARIALDLDAARAAKVQADNAVAELTAATRQAQATAQAEIAGAVNAAKEAAAAQAATLNADLERQLAAAEARIGTARTAAMGALRQVAGETAVDVIVRLTGATADRNQVDQAVGNVLTARGLA
jgi:F-type H+-transporting ATPase subunit b